MSTVLGKRTSRSDIANDAVPSHLATPDNTPNPKRPKTSATICDDDSNKENIPPLLLDAINRVPRTPRRLARRATSDSFNSPSRNSTPPTRRASSSDVFLETPPTTPPQLQPIHLRVRALLRATCNGSSTIAGRQVERDAIVSFIQSFTSPAAQEIVHSTLYISGSPGTGKTALVNAIINTIEDECKFIYVNCMALESTSALFAKMSEELGDLVKASRGRKAKGRDSKDLLMSLLGKSSEKCIFVLDELDHIATSSQDLSSLFDIAAANTTSTRIIGIANTHTLTAGPQLAGLESDDVQTLHFAPYTADQMLAILQTRLSSLSEDHSSAEALKNFLPNTSLTLLSKKIASQTGDVRALFEVLRGAIDVATMAAPRPKTEAAAQDVNPLSTFASVQPSHINTAFKTYTPSKTSKSSAVAAAAPQISNEIITKVRDLGIQARLVILAILLASKRFEANLPLSGSSSSPSKTTKRASLPSSASDIDATALHTYYVAVLKRATGDVFSPVSRSEFADLLGLLETTGLVSLSLSGSPPTTPTKGRRSVSRSASFSGLTKGAKDQTVRLAAAIRVDDILRGLGISESQDAAGVVDPRQEEVNAIWTRETARTAREAKQAAGPKKAADVFDDACED
ncbi:P-loop containing nucleoside triphosphate hydrolase protein [Heliocybe sulcata]|uniref:P-loop containing nucleoside triphosphate hydrolase protein n=1 Tax=Heliocybe sulcata TaxID=5364 RepID=A0A5C3NBG7_9AGAM|nr:P-loop containing nucleoside triphosphate hydrolase protein [Heliocybe sulcata]